MLICISLFLLLTETKAQEFSSRVWHKGWLVTLDGDTLRGELKYDMETNTVQVLDPSQKVNTLNSKRILYFEFFDSILKNYRQFYAIPYEVRTDFRAPILFEVLYEGPTTLLCREKIVMEAEAYSQGYYYSGAMPMHEQLALTYYFAFRTGEIVQYSGKKADLFMILDLHGDQVKEYIRKNRLSVSEVRDLIRIVAFYNSL
ncbi:hypothetical protein [Reichenbachiella sp. 5M10]|uniref:hypothetical protein n=1 Tax=Reichenbachiella sp. 5M10 TaxID=1889772 RepID=UPI00117B492D|nr:hypothetical protein [Reichenbachiella sp. 5M10]